VTRFGTVNRQLLNLSMLTAAIVAPMWVTFKGHLLVSTDPWAATQQRQFSLAITQVVTLALEFPSIKSATTASV